MNNVLITLGAILLVIAIGYFIYVIRKAPSNSQLASVKEWLLYAVAKAEKELGSGTGQLKLRYVYDMFILRFGNLSKVISFAAFSMLVDEALDVFKAMLDTNKSVNKYVGYSDPEENDVTEEGVEIDG